MLKINSILGLTPYRNLSFLPQPGKSLTLSRDICGKSEFECRECLHELRMVDHEDEAVRLALGTDAMMLKIASFLLTSPRPLRFPS
jgi:hypothetical protein